MRGELGGLIRRSLVARADCLFIEPSRLRVNPILNWGGFVNASFTATDDCHTLHVKVATEPEMVACLRQWLTVHEQLTAAYHAPRLLDSFVLPEEEGMAVVFAHIAGSSPTLLDDELKGSLCQVLQRLHGDRILAAALGKTAPAGRTCADAYLDLFHQRFIDDLAIIDANPPPFLSADRAHWLRGEADRLCARVRAAPAFMEPAEAPTHSDLWLENILCEPCGAFWILDWDDLALSDPAIDLAVLFGPTTARPEPVTTESIAPGQYPLSAALRERLLIYGQATVLDWIIDPLADWVDADAAGPRAEEVRVEKRRIHEAALQVFHQRYDRQG